MSSPCAFASAICICIFIAISVVSAACDPIKRSISSTAECSRDMVGTSWVTCGMRSIPKGYHVSPRTQKLLNCGTNPLFLCCACREFEDETRWLLWMKTFWIGFRGEVVGNFGDGV